MRSGANDMASVSQPGRSLVGLDIFGYFCNVYFSYCSRRIAIVDHFWEVNNNLMTRKFLELLQDGQKERISSSRLFGPARVVMNGHTCICLHNKILTHLTPSHTRLNRLIHPALNDIILPLKICRGDMKWFVDIRWNYFTWFTVLHQLLGFG